MTFIYVIFLWIILKCDWNGKSVNAFLIYAKCTATFTEIRRNFEDEVHFCTKFVPTKLVHIIYMHWSSCFLKCVFVLVCMKLISKSVPNDEKMKNRKLLDGLLEKKKNIYFKLRFSISYFRSETILCVQTNSLRVNHFRELYDWNASFIKKKLKFSITFGKFLLAMQK